MYVGKILISFFKLCVSKKFDHNFLQATYKKQIRKKGEDCEMKNFHIQGTPIVFFMTM
jgi:hypothetical protein